MHNYAKLLSDAVGQWGGHPPAQFHHVSSKRLAARSPSIRRASDSKAPKWEEHGTYMEDHIPFILCNMIDHI